MASDVVVENFKPGTMARLGLDAEKLQGMKAALVYASISGFGQNQPTLAGYDQIAQGTSSMMSMNATPEGPPTKVGVPIGDITAGMFASQAILAALVERASTGKGRRIDVALNDSLLALHTYQAGRLFATGEVPTQEGNHHATIAPYGTFAVSDGFINLAVATDAQFARLSEAIHAPELADDPRFATNALRQAARPALVRAIEARLRQDTREHWLARFEQAGIPAGPILDIEEAFASPLATERQMRVEVEHPKVGPDQPGRRAVEDRRRIQPDPHAASAARPAHRGGAARVAPPLTGIRVVEVGNYMAAPFCAMQLADLGAEVIKVEHPEGGDQVRQSAPLIEGEGSAFMRLNRNKRSIALDLKTDKGKEIFRKLVGTADVVVENLRPGTMNDLGLDYESLRRINPGLDLRGRVRLGPGRPAARPAGDGHHGPGALRPHEHHGDAGRRPGQGRRARLRPRVRPLRRAGRGRGAVRARR